MGDSQEEGYLFTDPYSINKDSDALGFLLGSPYLGKLPSVGCMFLFFSGKGANGNLIPRYALRGPLQY